MSYYENVPPKPQEIVPDGFFPWMGIASHHILAHDYLDAWFFELSKLREIKCFYILSPEHFNLAVQPYSLTYGAWESGFGLVETDKKIARRLLKRLNVEPDPNLFRYEHGTSTFIPYIKKYFPQAKVAVIAYFSEHPVNLPIASKLADTIEKEFDNKGKRDNFLLISCDFSHRGDIETTKKRDDYSRAFLKNSNDAIWNLVYCDNMPAMYFINRLRSDFESVIYFYTNSWEIINEGEDDITSYFFVYFADKKGSE